MNTEILLELAAKLTEEEDLYPVQDHLAETASKLARLATNPQELNFQSELKTSLASLTEHLSDRESDLSPKEIERIREIGGEKYFTFKLVEEILSAIQSNPMTPSVAAEIATECVRQRKEFIDSLGPVDIHLDAMRAATRYQFAA
jgi:hypothetical protein